MICLSDMEKFAVLKEWKKNWLEHNEKRNKMKYSDLEVGKTYQIDFYTTGVFTEIDGQKGFINLREGHHYAVSREGLVQFKSKDDFEEVVLNKPNHTKQTAVEWLVEQYENNFPLTFDAIDQAKQMEKEQIESAFNYAQIDLGMEADEYYNETFKNEKQ